jgi:AraC-like DNA-binding protein
LNGGARADNGAGEWVRYRRAGDLAAEAMHAHFRRHTYHRHSHQTYSFGLTELGAQAFTCRGAAHTSAAGMVMAFNPDEPHDGHPASSAGFTYRIVHLAPQLVADALADAAGRPVGLPLFPEPVLHDPALAHALRALHASLMRGDGRLARDVHLTRALSALVRRGASRRPEPATPRDAAAAVIAGRVRAVLHDRYADDLSAGDLAAVAGCSRYAVYRAFQRTYGMPPSDYQRQLRLRAARALLDAGRPAADVAVEVGFADQSHLTRWFVRSFGITPARYATGDAGLCLRVPAA